MSTQRLFLAFALVGVMALLLIVAGCQSDTTSSFSGVTPPVTTDEPSAGSNDQSQTLETVNAGFTGDAVVNSDSPEEATASEPTRMIGSDRRMAVVYECWYALRNSYLRTPNAEGPHGGRTINGNTVSDWNYLANDLNALQAIKGIYGSNVSVSSYFGTQDRYALQSGVGRGCQCVSFAALILYRALGGYRHVWTWSQINPANYPSARNAQPGDLVFRKTGTWHVAIVVKRLPDGLDLVDSNSVGYGSSSWAVGYYNGAANSEIIARHPLTFTDIDRQSWKTYSGKGRWY